MRCELCSLQSARMQASFAESAWDMAAEGENTANANEIRVSDNTTIQLWVHLWCGDGSGKNLLFFFLMPVSMDCCSPCVCLSGAQLCSLAIAGSPCAAGHETGLQPLLSPGFLLTQPQLAASFTLSTGELAHLPPRLLISAENIASFPVLF